MRKWMAAVAFMLTFVGLAVLRLLASIDDKAHLRIEQTQTIPADAPAIGSLVIWDDYLAWVSIPDASGKSGKVVVHDLEKEKTTTIAQDLYTGGPAWVRGSKETLVYMSFARLPCDDLPEDKKKATNCASQLRAWQIFSKDLRSGKQRQIAASKTEIDQRFPPLPEVSWPYVVWTAPPAEISPTPTSRGIALYDLEERKGKVMLTGTITGRTTIDGKTLVFTAAVPGADRWDLFAASANGKGRLKRLTTSGKVIFPRTGNEMVAWQEPSAAQPGQAPADFSLWARSVKGKGRPVRIADSGNNPVPGDGFVVWLGSPAQGGQLLAKDPYSKAEPIVLEQQPNFSAGWWAFGDRAVWATIRKDGEKLKTTIHVARVRVG